MSTPALSSLHRVLRDRAAGMPGGTITWRAWDCLLWWCDVGQGRTPFRRRWLLDNQAALQKAAQDNHIPALVLAGIAYQEVGGKPLFFDDVVDWLRRHAPKRFLPGRLSGDPNRTSYGPMAIQVRRGAETLGYDLSALTTEQRRAIIVTLKEPRQAIFVAAAHLADLKQQTSFAHCPAIDLTEEHGVELAARYNGGPYWRGRHAQRYARRYRTDLAAVATVLAHSTPKDLPLPRTKVSNP